MCDASVALVAGEKNEGWSCLKAFGLLDFSLTGLLSERSSVLAAVSISAEGRERELTIPVEELVFTIDESRDTIVIMLPTPSE